MRRALEPLIRRLMHFYWRFSRGATLGVRAMVIDGAGRIAKVWRKVKVTGHAADVLKAVGEA